MVIAFWQNTQPCMEVHGCFVLAGLEYDVFMAH